MIRKDQPTIFPDNVLVAVSSRADGAITNKEIGACGGKTTMNHTKFVKKLGVEFDDVVFQDIKFGPNRSYDLICEVDEGATVKFTNKIVADALATRAKNVMLMLPVADCVATVVFDPRTQTLALAHLGRHSTVANLAEKLARRLVADGSRAEDLMVWMSPSAQQKSYGMEWFDQADSQAWRPFCEQRGGKYYLDLQGYNAAGFERAGVLGKNIFQSNVDTVTDKNYFSYRAGDKRERFVVVAMIRG